MASVGLKGLKYAVGATDSASAFKYTATPETVAGLIEMSLSVNIAEAELFSDDVLSEYDSEFTDGEITLGMKDDDEDFVAAVLGKSSETLTVGSTTVTHYPSKVSDSAPWVGIGFVVPIVKDGVKKFKAFQFPKVTFKPYNENAKTKGKTLEFTTPSLTAKIAPTINSGKWKNDHAFATETEANAYINALFPVTP